MAKGAALAVIAFALLSGPTAADGSGLTIVANGTPQATIVVSAEAGEKVKTAAAELQNYVEKMSGARLEIATDDDPPQGLLILVGKSKLTEAAGVAVPSGLTNTRREEGFTIQTRANRLILAGNDEGPYHGTEYAVYELLNRLGIRWYMPGDFGEIIPRRKTITVLEMTVTEKPDFVMRNWWAHILPDMAQQEKRWKIRNKMNPDLMFSTPTDSSVRTVLDEKKNFETHPEYFALGADGKRIPGLPNLANPEAVKVVAENIKAYLRTHPEANSFGFAPDDGYPRDCSPESLKLSQGFTDTYGRPGVAEDLSISEEWFRFVNSVAEEVRREFPDVYIATNGYANRNLPPQGVKLDDHLVIMFAALWSCTIHAYDDPHCWQKVRQGQLLKRWTEMCPNVWVHGYMYQMTVSGLTPLPEVRKLRRDMPLMKKWGVIGFLDESRNVWAECGIPSRYVRAKLEWDADADVDAILDDFYSTWYGPAAKPMRAFYEALEDAIEKTPMHGHEDRILPEVYTPNLMASLAKHIAEAEKLALAEPAKARVRADRLIYEHLRTYIAMSAADAAGEFGEAAKQAALMMDIRKELHALSPFFIWPDEARYHSGIFYWGVLERQAHYEKLAAKVSGKTGDLVAFLPHRARFSTDPRDEGVVASWYQPSFRDEQWRSIEANRPFYVQGYLDGQGYPYLGYIWYRFKADIPASAAGKKVLLCAPVVETEGWCWVNGEYVGHGRYRNAHVRPAEMELDVTKAIQPGKTNTIALRISTSLSAAQAASGLLSRVFLYAPR